MPSAAALAIARMEGYYDAQGRPMTNTRAYRNNNPGNIWDGVGNGKVKRIWPSMLIDDKGFIIYPTAAAGWAELERQLQMKAARGLTLQAALTEWAPPIENDTAAYVRNVENWTGYAAGTPLQTVLAGGAGGRIVPATGVQVAGGGVPSVPAGSYDAFNPTPGAGSGGGDDGGGGETYSTAVGGDDGGDGDGDGLAVAAGDDLASVMPMQIPGMDPMILMLMAGAGVLFWWWWSR